MNKEEAKANKDSLTKLIDLITSSTVQKRQYKAYKLEYENLEENIPKLCEEIDVKLLEKLEFLFWNIQLDKGLQELEAKI